MDTLSDEHLAELPASLPIPWPASITTASLQRDIIELSAHLNVASYRWLVPIARCLERLPRICEAFRTGEVSYSKVRAMTRVATPANEVCLLDIAWHGTATHVERTMQGNRRALRGRSACGRSASTRSARLPGGGTRMAPWCSKRACRQRWGHGCSRRSMQGSRH